jgi:hypothetical protein
VDDFPVGKREKCSTLAESDHNIGLSHEIIESFHEIFGDEVGPSLLIVGVLHDWAKNFIANGMHVFKNILGDLQEDDIVLEVLFLEFVSPNSKDDEACIG